MADVGRPTKYDPAYCDGVIAFASDSGRSLASYAAKIGVSRSTIQEWEKQHPEFSVAASIARAKIAAWWEEQAIDLAANGGNSTRGTLVIFGLKNMARDDWQEKLALVGGDETDQPIRTISRVIVDPRDGDGRRA